VHVEGRNNQSRKNRSCGVVWYSGGGCRTPRRRPRNLLRFQNRCSLRPRLQIVVAMQLIAKHCRETLPLALLLALTLRLSLVQVVWEVVVRAVVVLMLVTIGS
jgi:hypothetical protein